MQQRIGSLGGGISPSSATSPTAGCSAPTSSCCAPSGPAHRRRAAHLLPSGIGAWSARDGFTVSSDLDAVLTGDDVPDAVMMLRPEGADVGWYFPTARSMPWATAHDGVSVPSAGAANPDVAILHPGPMNRGLEISPGRPTRRTRSSSTRSPRVSPMRMAVLYHLLAADTTEVAV